MSTNSRILRGLAHTVQGSSLRQLRRVGVPHQICMMDECSKSLPQVVGDHVNGSEPRTAPLSLPISLQAVLDPVVNSHKEPTMRHYNLLDYYCLVHVSLFSLQGYLEKLCPRMTLPPLHRFSALLVW